jgi:hypothetical protein
VKILRVLLASAALLGTTTIADAGALVPNSFVNIAFTGFCDGMRLVINQTTGLVVGSRTGCLSAPLIGTVGANARLGASVTVSTTNNGVGSFLFVIDDVPQTWSVYAANGVLLNSGRYSVGFPARQRSAAPSTP